MKSLMPALGIEDFAISPAPHHDIYSIEDLHQLIYSLKEATSYKKVVSVKVAAVHLIGFIFTGDISRAGIYRLLIEEEIDLNS